MHSRSLTMAWLLFIVMATHFKLVALHVVQLSGADDQHTCCSCRERSLDAAPAASAAAVAAAASACAARPASSAACVTFNRQSVYRVWQSSSCMAVSAGIGWHKGHLKGGSCAARPLSINAKSSLLFACPAGLPKWVSDAMPTCSPEQGCTSRRACSCAAAHSLASCRSAAPRDASSASSAATAARSSAACASAACSAACVPGTFSCANGPSCR